MKLRITVEGKTYDVDVEVVDETQTPPAPPQVPAPSVKPPAARVAPVPYSRARQAARSDEKTCRSPLAGIVVSIAAAVGQAVAKSDLLLVIEAMKMETRILSEGDGTVKAVKVAAGDAVKSGQVLVEFE